MRWSILTPELSLHWDGETLTRRPRRDPRGRASGDPLEEMWKTYYASIFNPARLKVGAMLKEMPKKYWKQHAGDRAGPAVDRRCAQARERR